MSIKKYYIIICEKLIKMQDKHTSLKKGKKMKNVLVYGQFTENEIQKLQSVSQELQITYANDRKNITLPLEQYHAVIGNVPIDIVKEMKNLEWMQLISSGADAYAKDGVLPERAILTCATGAYGIGIAEYMIAMLLNMMKKVPNYLENQKNKVWQDEGIVSSPMGKRILLLGTGNIGLEFAKRIKAFGSYVVGIRNHSTICPDVIDEMHSIKDLKEEVSKADVIAMSLPGTKETFHLLDEETLKLCKNGCLLMNVGRGNALDTVALTNPEIYNRFSGIWLDVFEEEPLPSDSNLFEVPNLLMTPHITGGYHLDITIQNIFEICYHNLQIWNDGRKDYQSIVNRASGYAKAAQED